MSADATGSTADEAPATTGDAMEVDASTTQPASPPRTAQDATTEAQGQSDEHSATINAENPATSGSPPAAATDSMTDDPPQEPPPPPAKTLCGICNEKEGKYKCTRCKMPFCSVPCNKIHRENHPPDPDPPAAEDTSSRATAAAPATDGLVAAAAAAPDPRNPFSCLDTSEHLQYLFRRYPSLPQQLREIGAETDPPADAQPASLKEALLAKAAAVGRPKKEQWNYDVGIRKGKNALRKARKAQGDVGAGIREYTELIVHLTSEDARSKEAETLLRSQAAQRDTDLIRQLLEEEKR